MNTLVIFTRYDRCTRSYFDNFYGKNEVTNDFIYKQVILPDQVSPSIIFINDSKKFNWQMQYELKEYFSQLAENLNYFVYYHISSGSKVEHKEFIDNVIPDHEEYYKELTKLGDHHNQDGVHYFFIVNASEAFLKKEYDKFTFILSDLLKK